MRHLYVPVVSAATTSTTMATSSTMTPISTTMATTTNSPFFPPLINTTNAITTPPPTTTTTTPHHHLTTDLNTPLTSPYPLPSLTTTINTFQNTTTNISSPVITHNTNATSLNPPDEISSKFNGTPEGAVDGEATGEDLLGTEGGETSFRGRQTISGKAVVLFPSLPKIFTENLLAKEDIKRQGMDGDEKGYVKGNTHTLTPPTPPTPHHPRFPGILRLPPPPPPPRRPPPPPPRRSTIVVRKNGARLHIPVIPSADFTSFKPQKSSRTPPRTPTPTPAQSRPQGIFKRPVDKPSSSSSSSTARPQVKAFFPKRPSSPSTPHKPRLPSTHHHKYHHITTPNHDHHHHHHHKKPPPRPLFPRPFLSTNTPSHHLPPHPRPRPLQPGRGVYGGVPCGGFLLTKMEHLMGRELAKDVFGMTVYEAVMER